MASLSDNPPVYRPLAHQDATSGPAVYYQPGDAPSNQVVVIRGNPEDYVYVPSNYIILSTLLSVVCCIFSPLVAVFINLPAVVLSWMSRQAYQEGKIVRARTQGVVAAYLNVCAVFTALTIAVILTPLLLIYARYQVT